MMTTITRLDANQFSTFMVGLKLLTDEIVKLRTAVEKLVEVPDDTSVMASTTADLAASAEALRQASAMAEIPNP